MKAVDDWYEVSKNLVRDMINKRPSPKNKNVLDSNNWRTVHTYGRNKREKPCRGMNNCRAGNVKGRGRKWEGGETLQRRAVISHFLAGCLLYSFLVKRRANEMYSIPPIRSIIQTTIALSRSFDSSNRNSQATFKSDPDMYVRFDFNFPPFLRNSFRAKRSGYSFHIILTPCQKHLPVSCWVKWRRILPTTQAEIPFLPVNISLLHINAFSFKKRSDVSSSSFQFPLQSIALHRRFHTHFFNLPRSRCQSIVAGTFHLIQFIRRRKFRSMRTWCHLLMSTFLVVPSSFIINSPCFKINCQSGDGLMK